MKDRHTVKLEFEIDTFKQSFDWRINELMNLNLITKYILHILSPNCCTHAQWRFWRRHGRLLDMSLVPFQEHKLANLPIMTAIKRNHEHINVFTLLRCLSAGRHRIKLHGIHLVDKQSAFFMSPYTKFLNKETQIKTSTSLFSGG